MQEIKCPECGKVFQVDESGYAAIVKQVRDKEFSKEIKEREAQFKAANETALNLAKVQASSDLKEQLAKKDAVINELNEKHSSEIAKADLEIAKLNEKLHAQENVSKSAIKNAEAEKDKEIIKLRAELENAKKEMEAAVNAAVTQKDNEIARLNDKLASDSKQYELKFKQAESEKAAEISELMGKINSSDADKKLAVNEAKEQMQLEISGMRETIIKLESDLKSNATAYENKEIMIRQGYEDKLKEKDAAIEYYKDFKARLSTKMIGESLEQHCNNEFNKVRHMAFPNAYFEKDNDISTGSKGDFIFKDHYYNDEGKKVEYVSIMFEMKNESDDTVKKHKNEDFFKELDKDRIEKKCEYAVLVSMLEADNDYYNSGIVDVSHRYPKMFVIRPQFFLPMISLIRNSALSSIEYKKELAKVQNQNIDISNFEFQMEEFKRLFGWHYKNAKDRFDDAIKQIDNAITQLQNVRNSLTTSANHLDKANNRAEELTVKRLTKNSPSIAAKFAELHADE